MENIADRIADEIAKKKWKEMYSKFDEKRAIYDGWFDEFEETIQQCNTPIIDLGCGNGNNSQYLAQKGKTVIACDYTEEALALINENMPEVAQTLCFDMRDGLPFEDDFTDVIIADLCLHYFTEEDTFKILREIKRVLKPNGILLFRVNSVNDINYGSTEGEEISRNYRRTDKNGDKRYFDKTDLEYFFKEFSYVSFNEETMTKRYSKPKVLWKGIAKK